MVRLWSVATRPADLNLSVIDRSLSAICHALSLIRDVSFICLRSVMHGDISVMGRILFIDGS